VSSLAAYVEESKAFGFHNYCLLLLSKFAIDDKYQFESIENIE